jgi:hypothetical protein
LRHSFALLEPAFIRSDMSRTSTLLPLLLGDGRAIKTLADARAVILSLPEHQQRRPYWEYAGQLLMDAVESDEPAAMDEAYRQLVRALSADRMMA